MNFFFVNLGVGKSKIHKFHGSKSSTSWVGLFDIELVNYVEIVLVRRS